MRCIEVIFAIRDHPDRGLLLRELGSVVLLVLCSYYLDNLRADLLVMTNYSLDKVIRIQYAF